MSIDPTTMTSPQTVQFTVYSSTGTTPTPSSDFTADQLGALWGVAYQRQTQRVFTSSFLKRHTGLGRVVWMVFTY